MPLYRRKDLEAQQVPDPMASEADWLRFGEVAEWCRGVMCNDAEEGRCIVVRSVMRGTPTDIKARPGSWIVKTHPLWFEVHSAADFAAQFEAVGGVA